MSKTWRDYFSPILGTDWRKPSVAGQEKTTRRRVLEYLGGRSEPREEIVLSFSKVGVPEGTTAQVLKRMLRDGDLQEAKDGRLKAVLPVKLLSKQGVLRLGMMCTSLGCTGAGALAGDATLFIAGSVLSVMVGAFLALF